MTNLISRDIVVRKKVTKIIYEINLKFINKN